MLVVVEHGNVQLLFQRFLNVEAIGRGDILQIHAAEGGSQQAHGLDDLLRVFCIQADGERIHTAALLKQDGFALHDGHGRRRADIAQPQHRRAVGHNSHQVSLGCIGIGRRRVFGDLPAGLGHARGICRGQVVPGLYGHLGRHLDLALVLFVQLQRRFVIIHISAALSVLFHAGLIYIIQVFRRLGYGPGRFMP